MCMPLHIIQIPKNKLIWCLNVLKWDVSQNIAFYHGKNDNLVKSGTLFLLNTTTCQLSQHWISANDFQTKVITCNIQQSSSTTSSTNWNFSNRLKFHREKQVVGVVSNPFPHKQHVASSSCTAGTIKHVEVPNQISWRYTHIHIYTYIPIICIDVYNIYLCIYICIYVYMHTKKDTHTYIYIYNPYKHIYMYTAKEHIHRNISITVIQ